MQPGWEEISFNNIKQLCQTFEQQKNTNHLNLDPFVSDISYTKNPFTYILKENVQKQEGKACFIQREW